MPDLTDPGFEPQTSRTDSNILATELTGRFSVCYLAVFSVWHAMVLAAEAISTIPFADTAPPWVVNLLHLLLPSFLKMLLLAFNWK